MKGFGNFILVLIFLSVISISAQIEETISCVNDYINSFQGKMRPQLFQIFKKTFPNTLSTTVQHYNLTKDNQYTYIITGDIQAMWLRDSTNQWLPYLTMEKPCPYMKQLTLGLLRAQAQFIMVDPYTNAFKKFENPGQRPSYLNDKTQKLIMGIPVDLCRKKQYATPSIWERKYQIDSLASFLRLTAQYYKKYNETTFITLDWIKAVRRMMTTLDEQSTDSAYQKQNKINFYTFYRDGRQLPNGTIRPSAKTGMIKTGFRPSDDANQLPYNVPGNAMMATFLEEVANGVLSNIPSNSIFKTPSQALKLKFLNFVKNIRSGIQNYGIVKSQGGKDIFAYQVNGFGDYRLSDDANLPSILSMAYLGYVGIHDPVYQNTRSILLSSKNPYYYQNGLVKGIGSPHTPYRYIWPLSLIVEGMTSDSQQQIKNCLNNLQLGAKNNLMHESFSVDNVNNITREWFAWANSFFGQFIIWLSKNRPELLM